MFINEDIPMDIVYNGKHFPEYDYKGSLATVAVTCKGETEYLYLQISLLYSHFYNYFLLYVKCGNSAF